MVAKISHGSNLYGALSYNQEKVDEGLGKVLSTNLILEPADGVFSIGASMTDFERMMPAHITTKNPAIHISLNPHPDDKLTDQQLSDIGHEYMERLGYGNQPYIIFKHEDIDRQHIHIVGSRVQPNGRPVSDKMEKRRSAAIVEDLERKYNLIPAKGQKQGEAWQLAPVNVSQGNLKKQVANVIKPLSEMYRFQTLGEYRALLSLYNIGVEEIKGENKGNPYRGLVYSALDSEGNRVGKPLKSSLFGTALGFDGLETKFGTSKETIKADGVTARTRAVVSEALNSTRTESEFRAALQKKGIDLVFRRNDEGRIFGATFIDHNERAVLNGSRLGKEFSANVLNERFADDSPREDLQTQQPKQSDNLRQTDKLATDKQPQAGHFTVDDAAGSLLSVLTPETQGQDNNQPTIKRKKKKKRRYGRQL
ncbi:conjugal transfer protein MobB [Bacteroides sp. 519]|uniref:conjugal transfer protein MobB n=1 Tax=Bacteroides sp. 519 TaxID=2302937 RepID=UPI0013D7CB30|nr:conjugal transfer protein MobB [Bacteroides sp. 519]NDV56812.1 mobilization protein [Bacteroides sp. 519]